MQRCGDVALAARNEKPPHQNKTPCTRFTAHAGRYRFLRSEPMTPRDNQPRGAFTA
ncbi:aldehyde-activating protein [Paraburkholderia caribensis MBA4]|uniref:Aldehyde-activating protein n=1 Tax=Paraburkholderia caribensis MBA4 TaxID=1323664 RepID=A0A0P0R5U1_9BURK|nr:aldehyde-activating protein [Paraburkholderia caribensis MBA4]